MDKLLQRVAVLADTFVTYAVFAVAALSFAADEIAKAAPEGSETVVSWLLLAVSAVTGAVAVVRRVTRVAKEQRGLLRQAAKQDSPEP